MPVLSLASQDSKKVIVTKLSATESIKRDPHSGELHSCPSRGFENFENFWTSVLRAQMSERTVAAFPPDKSHLLRERGCSKRIWLQVLGAHCLGSHAKLVDRT